MTPEHRRSPRINARLWIEVAAVDAQPALRSSNISMTGLFFETDIEIGPPGSLQRLWLSTFSRKRSVQIMGRVVRLVTTNDLWQGRRLRGIGLEFLVEGHKTRNDLQAVIRELAGTRELKSEEPESDSPVAGPDPLTEGSGIHLKRIDRTGMLIEADWPVGMGETIRCEILAPASGRRLRIEGRAQEVTPLTVDGSRYRVQVAFEHPAVKRPDPREVPVQGITLDDAMTVLLEETLVSHDDDDRPLAGRQSLAGSLDRIQLTSLLSFIEMEKMTGVLHMCRGTHEARIILSAGKVLNAVSDTLEGEPLELLRLVLGWSDGDFVFSAEPVSSADLVAMSTTGIILDLARVRDEEQHRRGP